MMKKSLRILFLGWMVLHGVAWASGGEVHLDKAPVDITDRESVIRGAETFVRYCLNCHSAAYMRYNRLGKDLGIDDKELMARFIYAGDKPGDTMTVAMDPKKAKAWFGTAPPDLTVIARARGADWLYTYLRSFYLDPARPWGVNNRVFKDVGMPHVLWRLQGLYEPVLEKDENGHEVITGMKQVQPGLMSPEEYDAFVADLVNYLVYMGEPARLQRMSLGPWVLLYLFVLLGVLYLLKKEYWKDVH